MKKERQRNGEKERENQQRADQIEWKNSELNDKLCGTRVILYII